MRFARSEEGKTKGGMKEAGGEKGRRKRMGGGCSVVDTAVNVCSGRDCDL